jgi:mRNA interferase MazF
MAKVPVPRRGEIWLVDFDPAVGAEVQKVRPAVVISVDTIGSLPLPAIALCVGAP